MVGPALILLALEGVVPGGELLLFAAFGKMAATPVTDAPRSLLLWVLVSILLSVALTVLLNLLLLL